MTEAAPLLSPTHHEAAQGWNSSLLCVCSFRERSNRRKKKKKKREIKTHTTLTTTLKIKRIMFFSLLDWSGTWCDLLRWCLSGCVSAGQADLFWGDGLIRSHTVSTLIRLEEHVKLTKTPGLKRLGAVEESNYAGLRRGLWAIQLKL